MKKRTEQNKTAFILTTVVAAVLLVAALLVFTFKNSQRITGENQQYLKDNTLQVAESIDSALLDGYDNIQILSAMVSDSLTEPEFDIASIQSLIKNSVFDFMEFADKDGMDHNITGGVSDAHDRKYYLDAKDGNTGMELIYVSRATHETLAFLVPFIIHVIQDVTGAFAPQIMIEDNLSRQILGGIWLALSACIDIVFIIFTTKKAHRTMSQDN